MSSARTMRMGTTGSARESNEVHFHGRILLRDGSLGLWWCGPTIESWPRQLDQANVTLVPSVESAW